MILPSEISFGHVTENIVDLIASYNFTHLCSFWKRIKKNGIFKTYTCWEM